MSAAAQSAGPNASGPATATEEKVDRSELGVAAFLIRTVCCLYNRQRQRGRGLRVDK